jgi:hypothetical protein
VCSSATADVQLLRTGTVHSVLNCGCALFKVWKYGRNNPQETSYEHMKRFANVRFPRKALLSDTEQDTRGGKVNYNISYQIIFSNY